ncbi:MAG: (Fe-S)-binding protein [Desulfobacterales bacterium]
MQYADILHRCFRCGYCKFPEDYSDFNCPPYLRYGFESFSPGGRMWLLRAWQNGDLEAGPRFADILFSCAACGNCVKHCAFPEFRDDLLNAFIAGKAALIENGIVPPKASAYFEAVFRHGNPFKLLKKNRTQWIGDLDIPLFSDQSFLFYVGDLGSYDEYGREMAYRTAKLMKLLGISFGILGTDEICDGNEIRSMGEFELFEHVASQNIANFNKAGVKRIITLSPHAFHVFNHDYPPLGGEFEIYHYSQIIGGAVSQLEFPEPGPPIRVAFHDPCYLGRHNDDYGSARAMLSAAPGVELVEMERNRQNALCCGGGGGNAFTDILGSGPKSAARVRVKEALATGAKVLAVACPQCLMMFEDAVRSEGVAEELHVMDIAGVITSCGVA